MRRPGDRLSSGARKGALLRGFAALLLLFTFLLGLTAFHHAHKPLPPGLSVETPQRPAVSVRFLADLTYVDPAGERHVDQRIFDEVFRIVRAAERRIVVDFFLWNSFQGERREETRALCRELTDALLVRKREVPGIDILVITDPINSVYGGVRSPHLDHLRQAGIPVVVTDLDRLRDSNWIWSSLWRWLVRPLGRGGPGLFSNPFGGDPVSLRTDLRILNFKANHRKTIVADTPGGWVGLVTSANPHDGSSAHGNVAIRFEGAAVADLLETERAVARFSGGPVPPPLDPDPFPEVEGRHAFPGPLDSEGVSLRVITEGRIAETVERELAQAGEGDAVAVAMFYLSDRGVVSALRAARARGASVRVLLDPNKDAFGRPRNGVPNRPVASELRRAGVSVRWCDTHGEQCHAKMLLVRRGARAALVLGSANFTRRNLRDLNLETNVAVEGPVDAAVFRDAWAYFEHVWRNEPGRRYSVDYAVFADESVVKAWLYRLSEGLGVGTF
jgi:phosphatidylserine/phosphatidylglycerophosphate/cardiolipin synthase-like enzyme